MFAKRHLGDGVTGGKRRSPRMLTRRIQGLSFRWRSLGIRSGSRSLFEFPRSVLRSRPFGATSCGGRIRLVLALTLRSRAQVASPSRGRLGRVQRPLDRLGQAEHPPSNRPVASHRPADTGADDRCPRRLSSTMQCRRSAVKGLVFTPRGVARRHAPPPPGSAETATRSRRQAARTMRPRPAQFGHCSGRCIPNALARTRCEGISENAFQGRSWGPVPAILPHPLHRSQRRVLVRMVASWLRVAASS
jgi:hypothetical protein